MIARLIPVSIASAFYLRTRGREYWLRLFHFANDFTLLTGGRALGDVAATLLACR